MAVSASLLTSGSSATDASSYATASIAPTGNALILAAVSIIEVDLEDAPVPTASGNGLTWVQVGTIGWLNVFTLDLSETTLFRAMGASPSSGAVTFSLAGNTQDGAIWDVVQFTGVDTGGTNGSGALVQSATAKGTTSTTVTATLASFGDATNNALFHVGCANATASRTYTPEHTELSDDNITASTGTVLSQACQWKLGEDTTPTMTLSSGATEWGNIACEVKAAPEVPVRPKIIVPTAAVQRAATW